MTEAAKEKARQRSREYYLAHKEEARQWQKAYNAKNAGNVKRAIAKWRKDNPQKCRGHRLKNRYGITTSQMLAIMEKQGHRCAICMETGGPPTGKRFLTVDHCHATLKVRGMLCNNCNAMIGHAKDKPSVLRVAALYLEGKAC